MRMRASRAVTPHGDSRREALVVGGAVLTDDRVDGGGVTLRGWLFVPESPGLHPAISMAHGYAGVS